MIQNGLNGNGVGGNGGLAPSPQVIEDLGARRHRRDTLAILRRAVEKGWEIPSDYKEISPKILMRIMADADSSRRDKIAAARVLAAMNGQNIQALDSLDKMDRMDHGEAPELVLRIIRETRTEIV